jgi:hypothetical protein
VSSRNADYGEGVIRSYNRMNGPQSQGIEYKRYKEEEDKSGPLEYHRAPLVPAGKYLRTLIECYRSLDRVPLMDAYHSDPDFAKEKHQDSLNWYYENVSDVLLLTDLTSWFKRLTD